MEEVGRIYLIDNRRFEVEEVFDEAGFDILRISVQGKLMTVVNPGQELDFFSSLETVLKKYSPYPRND